MASKTTAPTTCNVCCEKYNKTAPRRCITCHLCDYKSCATCIQTYLLGSVQDAHCMNCKRIWSKEFMLENFTAVFNNQTYKQHRENILMARQKSMLPLRVVKIERMIRGDKLAEEIKPLQDEIAAKRAELEKLERKYYDERWRISNLQAGREPLGHADKKNRVIEFHKRCPGEDCRGFLSTQYKCGICSIYVCPECYEIKGLNKDVEHTCKPENVESVKLKKKECRNCPECAAEIFKEVGCDQMWCTQCQTTFDWKTGAKLVNVKVHNPHYYEYLRRTQGSVPRDPDDHPPGAAGGACYNQHETYMGLMRIRNRMKPYAGTQDPPSMNNKVINIIDGLIEIVRVILHIEQVEVHRHTIPVNEDTNEDIDIQYLRKQIDEKTWKQMLQNREKQRLKKTEILQILQMVVQVSQDTLLRCIQQWILEARDKPDEKKKTEGIVTEIWKSLETLRAMANESFEKYAKLYKCQAPFIDLKAWQIRYPDDKYQWEFNLRHKYLA